MQDNLDGQVCDTYASLTETSRQPSHRRDSDEMKWTVPASGSTRGRDFDLDSCGLSASLFGNSAALKSFERKSGMSVEE